MRIASPGWPGPLHLSDALVLRACTWVRWPLGIPLPVEG
jgi:hypothetical protein